MYRIDWIVSRCRDLSRLNKGDKKKVFPDKFKMSFIHFEFRIFIMGHAISNNNEFRGAEPPHAKTNTRYLRINKPKHDVCVYHTKRHQNTCRRACARVSYEIIRTWTTSRWTNVPPLWRERRRRRIYNIIIIIIYIRRYIMYTSIRAYYIHERNIKLLLLLLLLFSFKSARALTVAEWWPAMAWFFTISVPPVPVFSLTALIIIIIIIIMLYALPQHSTRWYYYYSRNSRNRCPSQSSRSIIRRICVRRRRRRLPR